MKLGSNLKSCQLHSTVDTVAVDIEFVWFVFQQQFSGIQLVPMENVWWSLFTLPCPIQHFISLLFSSTLFLSLEHIYNDEECSRKTAYTCRNCTRRTDALLSRKLRKLPNGSREVSGITQRCGKGRWCTLVRARSCLHTRMVPL